MTGGGITLDLTITVGTIIEICVLSGGGLIALWKFTTKFALLAQEFVSIKLDISDMKSDIKRVNDVLAWRNESERRVGRLEEELKELRHGRGWIRGPNGIDREYS